jgi:CheY-specific phosphatase CheX
MPEPATQPVRQVFLQVLENLGFMFGDPVEKQELPVGVESCMEATIGYRGPTCGRLTLLVPAAIAGELAANLLGLDADDADARDNAADALGELMNVTIGQLLTAMAGEQAIFDLSPPLVVPDADAARWRAMRDDVESIGFLVEGRPALLQLDPQ